MSFMVFSGPRVTQPESLCEVRLCRTASASSDKKRSEVVRSTPARTSAVRPGIVAVGGDGAQRQPERNLSEAEPPEAEHLSAGA